MTGYSGSYYNRQWYNLAWYTGGPAVLPDPVPVDLHVVAITNGFTNAKFPRGERVKHSLFGKGTVLDSTWAWGTVLFDGIPGAIKVLYAYEDMVRDDLIERVIVTDLNERIEIPEIIPQPDPIRGNAPTNILLSALNVNEKSAGYIIGVVTVVDADLPNDLHVVSVDDGRFEIVDQILKLKDGVELLFSTAPTVDVTLSAEDSTSLTVSVNFTLNVIEQVVPGTNHPPTTVSLDNTTISDTELGAVVGNVVGFDPDLPNDTIVITVDDPRFVVVNNVLRLKPNKFVSHLLEPTIPLTLTVTDAGGLSADHGYILDVIDIPAPSLSNAYFVAPVARGLADGSSFANAFGVAGLNTVISFAALSGKQILLASHLGDYAGSRVTLSTGGANGAPVIIRGTNALGEEDFASFVGSRASPWTAGAAQGSDIFKFAAGADHLFFKNIDFTNCGNGCFSFTDNVSDITIDTCNATNVRRFIENAIAGTATAASITALRVRNCLVEGYSRSFARISYGSNNGSFENCVGDSLGQDGDSFAAGLTFEGTAHDIVVTGCTMRNHHDIVRHQPAPPGDSGFQNGDGYSTEATNYNINFVNCTASGNTDAGFDLKSHVIMTGCHSWDNRADFKLWSTAALTDCHGYDVNRRGNIPQGTFMVEVDHTTAAGNAAVTLTDCTFVDNSIDTIVFGFDSSTPTQNLTTINTSVQKNAAATLLYNSSATSTASLDTRSGPPFTVNPVISAIDTAGETAVVTPGTVTGGVEDAFQWLRDGAYIDDAVSANYTTTSADVGAHISCRQFTIDANGYMSEATSTASAAIVAAGPVNVTLPVIIGPHAVGAILSVTPGTYTGIPTPTLGYAWRSNGVAISGATSSSFLVTSAQLGTNIDVVEIATNTGGQIFTVSAAIGPITSAVSTIHIRTTGHGDQSGNGWANAIPLTSINGALNAMAPDGVAYVRNDEGDYTVTGTINISAGSTSGHPKIIKGVDVSLTPGFATIVGSRTTWTAPGDPETVTDVRTFGNVGNTCFQLSAGADNLTFDYIGFRHVGQPYNCRASITGLHIKNLAGYNVRRFFAMDSGTSPGAIAPHDLKFGDDGVAHDGIGGNTSTITGYSKQCFQARANGYNFEWYNIVADCARQEGDQFPNGISFDNQFHGGYCYRFDGNNCGDRLAGSAGYWNGDGISCEYSNYDITLEECNPTGNLDGGFDMKGLPDGQITYINCNPTDNCFNFKTWGATFASTGQDFGRSRHTVSGGSSVNPHRRGGNQSCAHFTMLLGADVLVRDSFTYSDVGGCYVVFAEELPVIFREGSTVSGTTAGPGFLFPSSYSVHLTGLDESDVTAPTITSSASPSYLEERAISYALTANESNMNWDIVGGADQAQWTWGVQNTLRPFTRSTVTMAAKDFEVPTDANADNTYTVQFRGIDGMRNATTITVNAAITNTDENAAPGVTFDGTNDYMLRGGNLSGAADSTAGSFSGWVKFNGGNAVLKRIISNDVSSLVVYKTAANKIQVYVSNSGGNHFAFETAAAYTSGATWYHIAASWDTNHSAGTKVGQLYINGVSDYVLVSDTGGAFGAQHSLVSNWAIGAHTDGTNKLDGDLAELWVDLANRIDFSVTANLRKFFKATGKPEPLGISGQLPTGTAPILCLKGPAAYFNGNNGTGGNFVVTGTLTDASTNPSD